MGINARGWQGVRGPAGLPQSLRLPLRRPLDRSAAYITDRKGAGFQEQRFPPERIEAAVAERAGGTSPGHHVTAGVKRERVCQRSNRCRSNTEEDE
jgi:hypothetical protein